MSPEMQEKLESLKPAVGDRVNMTYEQLSQILDNLAQPNNQLLSDYYKNNPKNAQFLSIIKEKEVLSKEDFSKKIEEFYSANDAFRDPAYQKNVYNEIRQVIPEGQLIKVSGGYAVLRSEKRTGRSPNGTFPVENEVIKEVEDFKHTKGSVSEVEFAQIYDRMIEYLKDKTLYETNRFVGQGMLSIPVKVITEKANVAAFTINMFRKDDAQMKKAKYDGWTIIHAPSFLHHNEERFPEGVFKFTDYKQRCILIGGTGYAGEVKKSMFAIANHMYPLSDQLSFHCSSVFEPETEEITLVFGLSGTGKSTVGSGIEGSKLLSDDETALNLITERTFNLENGNYYKTGGLLSEPKVLKTLRNMREGEMALYENIVPSPNAEVVFGADPTNNGRVSIRLSALDRSVEAGMYPLPTKIIILSRDVNAILDPINVLSKEQIIFYLNLGYTSKTPGTETGITKPIPTYSKWEGGPFYDLKDEIIMKALLKFLNNYPVEGVLINSGEGGGPFGSEHNKRFPVDVTLELAKKFMTGDLTKQFKEKPDSFEENPLLGTKRPKYIEGVSDEINSVLNAEALWTKNGFKDEYQKEAKALYTEFVSHAKTSLGNAAGDGEISSILSAGPNV